MTVVGKSRSEQDVRAQIYDDQGLLREGTIIVKIVRKCGPYGYMVHWNRAEKKHDWQYLGIAEPGLAVGTYAVNTPLKFYRGHARNLDDKQLVLVGKWDSWRTTAELDVRLEHAAYLPEAVE